MTSTTSADFPPYSYVPGHFPHPISNPAGHSFGLSVPKPEPIDPENWQASTEYLRGIELFEHGYYWEAHEVWESLWHAAGRTGPIADFLKALIKLAATGVKVREGNAAGVTAHSRRAGELLRRVSEALLDQQTAGKSWLGFDLTKLIEFADEAIHVRPIASDGEMPPVAVVNWCGSMKSCLSMFDPALARFLLP